MNTMDDDLNGLDAGGLFPRLQSRYGLRSDPTAMETPFFPDAQRQHALESLRHLCGFGDLALLLTGAKGSGKTRILAELVRSESARLGFHRLPTAALTSAQALSRELLGIAHQSLAGNGSPRDAVYGFFRWSETATRKGQRLVLLVDDADRMPQEVTRLLLDAFRAADCAKAAVPVFAGSDQLVQALGLENDGAEVPGVYQIHLRPLTREEISAYLEPRVRHGGGKVEELLSSRNLNRIHELSQGSFGRLKRVTPAVWLDLTAAPASRRRLPPMTVLRWPALALILLAVSWWFVAEQYETVSTPPVAVEEPVRERKTISLGPDHPDVLVSSNARDPQSAPEPGQRLEAEDDAAAPLSEGPVGLTGNRGDQVEREMETPDVIEPKVEVQPPVEVVSEAEPPAEGESERQADPGAEPESEAGSESIAVSESVPDPEPQPDPQPLAELEPVSEPEQLSAPEPEPTTPTFAPALPERFEEVASVRRREGYTAQFIAGFEEATVVSFLRDHASVSGLRYTRTELRGRPWFVVFYGQYDTRDQAGADLASLPGELGQSEPWIRPLANM